MHPLLSLHYVAQDNPELQILLVLLPKCRDYRVCQTAFATGCVSLAHYCLHSMLSSHQVSLIQVQGTVSPYRPCRPCGSPSLHALSNSKDTPYTSVLVLAVASLGWNLTCDSLTPVVGRLKQPHLRGWAVGTREPGNRAGGNLPSRQVQEPSTGEQVPPLLQLHTEEQLGP